MRSSLNHPRAEDARRAVEGGERLAQLGHPAAYARLPFDQVHLVSGVGELERCRDAGNPSADHERIPAEVDLLGMQRFEVERPLHPTPDERLGLGGCGVLVLVNP